MATTTRPLGSAELAPAREPRSRNRWGLSATLIALIGVLVLVCFLSIVLGTRGVGLPTIVRAFTDYDPGSTSQTVIRELRVPRTLVGLLAGAALGLAGALLQGLTRNPLADPGIMGINAGAAAAIVTGIAFLGFSGSANVWVGFAGAGLAVVLVYGVASFGREGATPVKLALAGAAVSAGLYSVMSGIIMLDTEALNELRFWQVGALAGRYWPVFEQTSIFLAVGIALALLMGRWLNGLALGEDLAVAMGQNLRRTRAVTFLLVAILAGAAVAACGPIVFVGLVVPHVARAICGPDYRWILPFTAVLSPIIMLLADIIGRVAARPGELQVGVVLGVLGAPAFIALVRRRDLAQV